MNIVLIGYRGTGKSTVARLLADALAWPWLDADVELESRAGRSVSAIFAEDGEQAFRDLETQVIADFAAYDKHVLALGGGAILRPENRKVIAQLGSVVWLQADPHTIHVRLKSDATTWQRRPNLTATGGLEEITSLLRARAPLYRQCAQVEIDTTGRSPATIAAEVLRRLGLDRGAEQPA